MSASLVGSEMCIRDRSRTSQHGLPRRCCRRCPSRRYAAPLRPELWPPTLGPVSYTHLRAHETSAHL
eukprot:5382338-Alexandrium_andersonii.AAC.1